MNDESNPRRTQLLAIDQRPGALPEIISDGANVAYVLPVVGTKDGDQLVIRCDDAGEVWVSIRRSE